MIAQRFPCPADTLGDPAPWNPTEQVIPITGVSVQASSPGADTPPLSYLDRLTIDEVAVKLLRKNEAP
jgi:hypothetical protein